MQDSAANAFKDRSAHLTIFGALAILAGCGCLLFALLHILLLLGPRLPGMENVPVDARAYVMGALLYLALGIAFVWVGAGSMRKRRWARPLMLTLAWTWFLGGVAVLVLLPALLAMTLGASIAGAPPMDPAVLGLTQAVLMFGTALFGVLLPALFVWTYNDRNLRLTCEAYDTRPDWSEHCPPAVLGLSIGLGACAVVVVLTALRPVVPMFGVLVTGWPGALVLLVYGALCAWLAREIYAVRVTGWWATTVFLILTGVSTWLTVLRVEPAEMLRAMGHLDDSPATDQPAFRSLFAWLTIVMTLASVGYMATIHKHFKRRS